MFTVYTQGTSKHQGRKFLKILNNGRRENFDNFFLQQETDIGETLAW